MLLRKIHFTNIREFSIDNTWKVSERNKIYLADAFHFLYFVWLYIINMSCKTYVIYKYSIMHICYTHASSNGICFRLNFETWKLTEQLTQILCLHLVRVPYTMFVYCIDNMTRTVWDICRMTGIKYRCSCIYIQL